MKLVIDLECENRAEVEDKSDELQQLVEYVAHQVGQGYTSSYEPSWSIEDETDPDTLYWLKLMRDQIRTGQHISESDMQQIVRAVDEIEALRERMIKERKAK